MHTHTQLTCKKKMDSSRLLRSSMPALNRPGPV